MIVTETRIDCFLRSYPLLEHCHRVSVSALSLVRTFRPTFRLTFYLRRDDQLGAYQHGQQHFSLVHAMTLKQRREKTNQNWMNQQEHTFHFPQSFVFVSVCVCAVEYRAQLHDDVSSEVMATSLWCQVWDFLHLEWGSLNSQTAEERYQKDI